MRMIWRSLVGTVGLVLLAGIPAGAATLNLVARFIKSDLLAGEPIILHVTLSGDAPVKFRGDLTDPYLLRVLVERGQGWVQFREKKWVASSPVVGIAPPVGGSESREYVLSYDANTADWVFPQPGTYSLVVEYVHPQLGVRRSNMVTLTVRPPAGNEKVVHDELRRLGPEIISVHEPERLGPLADLVSRYPNSVYLQQDRLNDLAARLERIRSGYDPDQPPSEPGEPLETPDLRPDVLRSRRAALLSVADSIAEVPGPFQPLALYESGHLYRDIGDDGTAQSIFGRIVREFGDRLIAQAAREELADQEPPRLDAQAAPATLWPPNNKLVPVTVAVTVSDDTDPTPATRLVSITCDDACSVSQDIADAALNTDDRSFQLRATRLGGGTGRTYTITYSATDDAGNQTTTRTTVRVPHDQGK